MSPQDLARAVEAAWKRHNDLLIYLVEQVPAAGFAAVPTGSRGRDVARQLAHLTRVRTGWVHYHRTGKRPKLPRGDAGPRPPRAQLKRSLRETGQEVGAFLAECLQGQARPRMFGRDPVRWMTYLVSHESHHRGQILLALKQASLRLPEKVAVQGLWGRWISGR